MNHIKKILTSFIVIISVFTINNNVKAEKAYDLKETELYNTDTLVRNDDMYDQSIVICAYGCSEENMGIDGSKCGGYNSPFSKISYNFDESVKNKWNITMNIYMYDTKVIRKELGGSTIIADKDKSLVNSFSWDKVGELIPMDGIYYEEPIKSGKVNEGWDNTTAYKELKNSLKCPQYFYYDHTIDADTESNKKNNMELCYADTKEKCNSRDEDKYTKFGYANELKYSFINEVGAVLTYTNIDIKESNGTDFLLNYYATEDDVCTVLKKYTPEQLVNDLENNNYENYVNEIFKKHIDNSPNEKLITYKTIKQLSNYFIDPINDEYNSIKINYSNKISESTEHYLRNCSLGLSEQEISEYVKAVNEQMTDKISKIEEGYSKVLDFESLTCDELLGDIAEIISTGYFYLEIIAIIIAIALTVLDYAKVILSDGQDAMKKTNQKLVKRLIIVVIILLLPALVNLILSAFNIENFNSENPLCKINK